MQLEFVIPSKNYNIWIGLGFCSIPVSYYRVPFNVILIREPDEVEQSIFQVEKCG